jgi:hypothetical protein
MWPFAGIVTPRPYPPTGLTTARWAAEVQPVEVAFADLWLTQDHLRAPALFGIVDRESDVYPHVVQWRGQRFLEDGHNRVVRAALTGDTTSLPMRVYIVH